MFTNMIFEHNDLRICYDESLDKNSTFIVAARDRNSKFDYERWVIEHLSVNDVRILRDALDVILEKLED
ncbi:MAG: hypothetical protein ACLS2Y_08480 [Mediterraneibacter faecis]|nr:MAG TPA: hypothetical protein [Caudoviricetes sp.]